MRMYRKIAYILLERVSDFRYFTIFFVISNVRLEHIMCCLLGLQSFTQNLNTQL